MDLEAKLLEVQKDVVEGGATRKTRLATDWIPRPPERFELVGHRAPITKVTFHPTYRYATPPTASLMFKRPLLLTTHLQSSVVLFRRCYYQGKEMCVCWTLVANVTSIMVRVCVYV